MTKAIKISIAASALIATSAFAGTVNTGNYTIANELINGQASGAINVADKLMTATNLLDTLTTNDNTYPGYSPSNIPAISLANGTVILSASSGNLAVVAANVLDSTAAVGDLVLVEDANKNGAIDAGDIVIAKFANTAGGKLSFASDASVSFTNDKSYVLGAVVAGTTVGTVVAAGQNPAAVAANAITLSTVAQGTDTVSFTTALYSTDTQTLRDSATSAFVTTPAQLAATVTTAANGVIDAINAEQKLFTAGALTDTITVTVTPTNLDTDAVAATDAEVLTLTSSKPLPVGMTATITDTAGATITDADSLTAGTQCAISADRMTTTCTMTAAAVTPVLGNAYTVTYSQPAVAADRNAIKDAVFTAMLTHDFTTAAYVDYTAATPLLNGSAGAWTYNGYTGKVPHMYTNTFVKLVNKNTIAATVTADLQDDAGHQCHGVELAALPANKAATYWATGSSGNSIKEKANAATGVAGDNCAAVTTPYSVEIFATVNPANVETLAVQKGTSDRVLPVYTNRNSTVGANTVDGK